MLWQSNHTTLYLSQHGNMCRNTSWRRLRFMKGSSSDDDDNNTCNRLMMGCDTVTRAGLRGGRAGPSPRAPRLRGPRGTSARGPAPHHVRTPRGGTSAQGTAHGSVSEQASGHLRHIVTSIGSAEFPNFYRGVNGGGWGCIPQHFGRGMQCLSSPLAATNLCQSSECHI